jgi:hypothetical protein
VVYVSMMVGVAKYGWLTSLNHVKVCENAVNYIYKLLYLGLLIAEDLNFFFGKYEKLRVRV